MNNIMDYIRKTIDSNLDTIDLPACYNIMRDQTSCIEDMRIENANRIPGRYRCMFINNDNQVSISKPLLSAMTSELGKLRGYPSAKQLNLAPDVVVGKVSKNIFRMKGVYRSSIATMTSESTYNHNYVRCISNLITCSTYPIGSIEVCCNNEHYMHPVSSGLSYPYMRSKKKPSTHADGRLTSNICKKHIAVCFATGTLTCHKFTSNDYDLTWHGGSNSMSIICNMKYQEQTYFCCTHKADALISLSNVSERYKGEKDECLLFCDRGYMNDEKMQLKQSPRDIFHDDMLAYAFGQDDFFPSSRRDIISSNYYKQLNSSNPYGSYKNSEFYKQSTCTCRKHICREHMVQPYSCWTEDSDNITSNKDSLNCKYSFGQAGRLDSTYEYCAANNTYNLIGFNDNKFGNNDVHLLGDNYLCKYGYYGSSNEFMLWQNYCCSNNLKRNITDHGGDILCFTNIHGNIRYYHRDYYNNTDAEKGYYCFKHKPIGMSGKRQCWTSKNKETYWAEDSNGNWKQHSYIACKQHVLGTLNETYIFRMNDMQQMIDMPTCWTDGNGICGVPAYRTKMYDEKYGCNETWVKDGRVSDHLDNKFTGCESCDVYFGNGCDSISANQTLDLGNDELYTKSMDLAYDIHRVSQARKFLYCGMAVVNCRNIEIGRSTCYVGDGHIWGGSSIGTGPNYHKMKIPSIELFHSVLNSKESSTVEEAQSYMEELDSAFNQSRERSSDIRLLLDKIAAINSKDYNMTMEFMNNIAHTESIYFGDPNSYAFNESNRMYLVEQETAYLRNAFIAENLGLDNEAGVIVEDDFYESAHALTKAAVINKAKKSEYATVIKYIDAMVVNLKSCPKLVSANDVSTFEKNAKESLLSLFSDAGDDEALAKQVIEIVDSINSVDKEISLGRLPFFRRSGIPLISEDSKQIALSTKILDEMDVLDNIYASEIVSKYGSLVRELRIDMVIDLNFLEKNEETQEIYIGLLSKFDARTSDSIDGMTAFRNSHIVKRFFIEEGVNTNIYSVRRSTFAHMTKSDKIVVIMAMVSSIHQNVNEKFCKHDVVIIAIIMIIITIWTAGAFSGAAIGLMSTIFTSLTILSIVALTYMDYTGHGSQQDRDVWAAIGVVGSIGGGISGAINAGGLFNLALTIINSGVQVYNFKEAIDFRKDMKNKNDSLSKINSEIKSIRRDAALEQYRKTTFLYGTVYSVNTDPQVYASGLRKFGDMQKNYNTYDILYGSEDEEQRL